MSWRSLYENVLSIFKGTDEKHNYFEKKKMTLLTKEELKSHQDAKLCYICRKRILKKIAKNKNYQKVRYYCYYTGKYRGAAHSICNLKFHALNGTPAAFRNGSN